MNAEFCRVLKSAIGLRSVRQKTNPPKERLRMDAIKTYRKLPICRLAHARSVPYTGA